MDQEKISRDQVIRYRFLQSLGIQAASIHHTHRPVKINVNLLSNDAPIRRSLNDSEEHNKNKKNNNNKQRPDSMNNRKRVVRFNSIVAEKQIASHKKYSDRIKRTLWSNLEEIQENAYRNQIEYQAEGMQWESVLENDKMYMNVNTGELIHPFWVESLSVSSPNNCLFVPAFSPPAPALSIPSMLHVSSRFHDIHCDDHRCVASI